MKVSFFPVVLAACMLATLPTVAGQRSLLFDFNFNFAAFDDFFAKLSSAIVSFDFGSFFAPPVEVDPPKFLPGMDPTGAIQFFQDKFMEIFKNSAGDSVLGCADLALRGTPSLDSVTDFESGIPTLMNIIMAGLCSTTNPVQSQVEDLIVAPFEAFFETLQPSQRRNMEADRKLQTPPSTLDCVERFPEGNLDGILGVLPPFNQFEGGGTNQYAWGTSFNDKLGFGVISHSLGTFGATIERQYSLATFTVRDREGLIVFQGALATPDTPRSGPNVGIRSATVIAVEETTDDTIITVLGTNIELERGRILEYKFSLKAYEENDKKPLLDIVPTRNFRAETPSVRSLIQISPNLAIYAPNTDITGSNDPVFIRVFNLDTWKIVGPRFLLTANGNPLLGVFWELSCSFDEGGLCFLNTVDSSGEGVPYVDFTPVPKTSYFPFASIQTLAADVVNQEKSDGEVEIPVTTVANSFDIEYSAQSLQPLDAKSNAVCTLSGFLFVAGVLFLGDLVGSEIEGTDFALTDLTDLGGFREILDFFQLGVAQQCDVCTGQLATSDRFLQLADNTCSRVPIEGIPKSTVYIWNVEECGGNIFIGTWDFADFLTTQAVIALTQFIANTVCSEPLIGSIACVLSGGPCTFVNREKDQAVCEEKLPSAIINSISPANRLFIQAFFGSVIFEEVITPNDLGFDLYVADREELLAGTGVFKPVTLNGFRELSPALEQLDPQFKARFGFEPSSPIDEAIRNFSCLRSDSGDRLVAGSATFLPGQASNTFVIETQCLSEALG